MKRRAMVVGVAASVLLTACGGGDGSSGDAPSASDGASTTMSSAPASSAPATVEPATSAAETTVAVDTTEQTGEPAEFDGPLFLDVIDGALAPYAALAGRPATVADLATALPAVAADTPLPAGLTIAGAGRDVERWMDGEVSDEQKASFAEPFAAADLEAFGAAAPAGWRQSSFATSGSLATLLLTPEADPRRVAYTADSAPAEGAPVLELNIDPGEATMPEPAWLASLPALAGGELVEVQEGIGTVTFFGAPARNGYVLVRWRYPADSLDALTAFLESGVVQSAGFTYDQDLFNGFQSLVEVTAGDWTGSVLIGETSFDDQVFHDLLWSLTRP